MSCTSTCVRPTPSQAHCAAGHCHRTFGSVSAFDRHRRGGECLHPEEVGMQERNGVWRAPVDERQRERLAAMRADAPSASHRTPQTAETPSAGVRGCAGAPEAISGASEAVAPKPRIRACVEAWPDCETGLYDPRCCRFPKSCSATAYDPEQVTEEYLEDA